MSTRKQLNATPQIRHPQLVSLTDETIAHSKEPEAIPSSSVGQYVLRDLLCGLALMGAALHASHEAIAMQSHILASAGGKKPIRAEFLGGRWRWLIRSKLSQRLCRKKKTVPSVSRNRLGEISRWRQTEMLREDRRSRSRRRSAGRGPLLCAPAGGPKIKCPNFNVFNVGLCECD